MRILSAGKDSSLNVKGAYLEVWSDMLGSIGVPEGIDSDAVAASLKALPGVCDLHDLHIWAITSGVPSLSGHLVIEPNAEGDEVRQRAVKHLDESYEIEHVTLQMEKQDCRNGRDHRGLQ